MRRTSLSAMMSCQTKLRSSPKLALTALALGATLASTSAATATNYFFTTLDNPADPTFNQPFGINDSGVIAGEVGVGGAGHLAQGYLLLPPYGQGQYASENVPGSVQTQVTGLNNKGTTVGFFSNTNAVPDTDIGFFNTGGVNGKFYQVVDPNTPNLPVQVNELFGVNDKNVAVGSYRDANGAFHGYTFNTLTWTFSADINVPFASTTVVRAINDAGVVAGTDMVGGVTSGFIDNRGVFTNVMFPDSTITEIAGLNDKGLAVGAYFDQVNNVHGFTYNLFTGEYETIDEPAGSSRSSTE
jgi:hypothetical protein